MTPRLRTSMVLAIGVGCAGTFAGAQTVERETSVTGPRGRTIQRDVTIQRGPGYVDRDVKVQRPGGTFERNTMIQRGPGYVDRNINIQRPGGARLSRETMIQRGPGVVRGFPGGGFRGFGGPTIIEEPVAVGGRGGGIGVVPALIGGAGLFGLGMLTQSALSAPPPPPPVIVASPPPTVVYNPPQAYQPGTAPPAGPTVVVDPVLEAGARLSSHYETVRRDAVVELGRYRDARAVPALIDRLKNDSSRHVRAAAATALGEIGDPRALTFLERAAEHDWRQEVRDAAQMAYIKLPRSGSAPSDPNTAQASTPPANAAAPSPTVPRLEPAERTPPPPQPEPPARN